MAWLGAGKELVTDQEKLNDATLYVQSLLELKDKSVHAPLRDGFNVPAECGMMLRGRTGRLHTALDRCDRLILEAFGNDNGFMHSVNEAFETFVNMSPVS